MKHPVLIPWRVFLAKRIALAAQRGDQATTDRLLAQLDVDLQARRARAASGKRAS